MKKRRTRISQSLPRLPGFLLASVCLHAGLLLSWALTSPRVSGQLETVLSVSFNTAEHPATPATPRQKDAAAHLPARPQRDTGERAPDSEKSSDTATASNDGSGKLDEPARARIQARLLTDLQRYFEYPLIARRQGWQGTVLLSVTVAADGTLDRIHIARSSGYDALDRSALSAARRIERLSDAGRWLDGRAFELPLPVIYRLIDR